MGKRVLIGLGVLVLVAVAAGGGFFYGRSVGQTRANQIRQQFARDRFGQGAPGPGANWTPQPGQEGGFRLGGGTMGTIDSIEGDTVVVSTQQGTVRVQTTDTTLIQKLMSVGVSELETGEQVMVSGSQNEDGSITARSIQSVRSFQGLGANQP